MVVPNYYRTSVTSCVVRLDDLLDAPVFKIIDVRGCHGSTACAGADFVSVQIIDDGRSCLCFFHTAPIILVGWQSGRMFITFEISALCIADNGVKIDAPALGVDSDAAVRVASGAHVGATFHRHVVLVAFSLAQVKTIVSRVLESRLDTFCVLPLIRHEIANELEAALQYLDSARLARMASQQASIRANACLPDWPFRGSRGPLSAG